MNQPLTSTSRFIAANSSPEEMRRAIAEQAIWIERQNQTNQAFQGRMATLEEDFEDWRNDRKQADALVLAKLDGIEVQLLAMRTAKSMATVIAKAAFALASLVIAAKAAGLF